MIKPCSADSTIILLSKRTMYWLVEINFFSSSFSGQESEILLAKKGYNNDHNQVVLCPYHLIIVFNSNWSSFNLALYN